jgi:hypothetical protein
MDWGNRRPGVDVGNGGAHLACFGYVTPHGPTATAANKKKLYSKKKKKLYSSFNLEKNLLNRLIASI